MWFSLLKYSRENWLEKAPCHSFTKEKAMKPVKAIVQQGATVFQSSLGLKLCSNTVTVLYG